MCLLQEKVMVAAIMVFPTPTYRLHIPSLQDEQQAKQVS
jgi:hypothetical protein